MQQEIIALSQPIVPWLLLNQFFYVFLQRRRVKAQFNGKIYVLLSVLALAQNGLGQRSVPKCQGILEVKEDGFAVVANS